MFAGVRLTQVPYYYIFVPFYFIFVLEFLMLKVDLSQFRTLAATGSVLSVTLDGLGKEFALVIETKNGQALLVMSNDREKARTFADPRRALAVLQEAGIKQALIKTTKWEP